MRRFTFTICLLLGLAAIGFAQAAKSKGLKHETHQ
jgi:hypothetical protein